MRRSSLLTTKSLNAVIANVKATGVDDIERDKDAGTVIIRDEDDCVCLQGIQKGHNQPWIVTFHDTLQVQWTWPEESKPCAPPVT